MTAKRLLLGTTVLTSLALAGAAPAAAVAPNLVVDNGTSKTLETSATYPQVTVGYFTFGNELIIGPGKVLESFESTVSYYANDPNPPAPQSLSPESMAPLAIAGQNTVRVSGEGAKWNTLQGPNSEGGSLTVGFNGGDANLIVENGGEVYAQTTVIIGMAETSSNNSVEVSGTDSSLSSPYVTIGSMGDGNSLWVSSGASVSSTTSTIGYYGTSSNNSATVTGVGSSWSVAGGLRVGNMGNANRLYIHDGGSVTAGSLEIGNSGSLGNNIVDLYGSEGEPSSLTVGDLHIGNDSSENGLLINGRGQLRSNNAIIGNASYGSGGANGNTVSLEGPSASWDIGNAIEESASADLLIGFSDVVSATSLGGIGQASSGPELPAGASGNGLYITGGATVTQTGGNTVIGSTVWDTENTLEISGAGSSFTTDGDVMVGNGNSLIVGSGASLTAGSLTLSETSLLSVYVADPVSTAKATPAPSMCAASGCWQNEGPSQIEITGTASLNGDLEAKIGMEDLQQNRYTLLTAGSIEGEFSSYSLIADYNTVSAMSALDARLVYTATGVYLSFASDIGLDENLNDNQSNVATALNHYYNGGGELPIGFMGLFGMTGPALEDALSQLSGEPGSTGGAAAAGQASNSFLNLLLGGFGPRRAQAPGMTQTAAAAQVGDVTVQPTADAPPAPASGWRMWGSAYGGTANLSGNDGNGSHDTGTDAMGLATGWDYALSADTQLGLAIAGGGTRWDIDSGLGSGDSTFLQLGAYGSQQFGASYLSVAGAYAWHAMSTERHVNIAGTRESLDADFNASNLAGRIEAGHRFGQELGLTPYAAFQAQAMYLPSYEEDGGDFALHYDSNTATALRTELGLGVDGTVGSTASLYARAAWAHDWTSDPSVNASFQSLPGANFTVYGAEAPENIALVSAGAEMALSEAATLSADFNGEFAEGYQSYAGSLKLAYSW